MGTKKRNGSAKTKGVQKSLPARSSTEHTVKSITLSVLRNSILPAEAKIKELLNYCEKGELLYYRKEYGPLGEEKSVYVERLCGALKRHRAYLDGKVSRRELTGWVAFAANRISSLITSELERLSGHDLSGLDKIMVESIECPNATAWGDL